MSGFILVVEQEFDKVVFGLMSLYIPVVNDLEFIQQISILTYFIQIF